MNKDQLTELTFFRGRVALAAILRGLNISKGDEVAIQAFTCVAVPEAVLSVGATPLYIDIEADGFNMDPEDLQKKISRKTKAIVVQHTFGIPADLDRLGKLASLNAVPLIEDCCHSFASAYNGQEVGHFGSAAFYSFEWGKPIVAGIGGSATVNDPELLVRMRQALADYRAPSSSAQVKIELQYIAHSILYRPSLYWPIRYLFRKLGSLGILLGNYKNSSEVESNEVFPQSDEFQMRMASRVQTRARRKLQGLETVRAASERISEFYKESIRNSALQHPKIPAGNRAVFARYPLLAEDKGALVQAACRARIELAEWYSTVVHPLESKSWSSVGYQLYSCPEAERRCGQVVSLPTHSKVSKSYLNRCAKFLNSHVS